jgi:site-specific DNA-methyltransferase (adenine-specific)
VQTANGPHRHEIDTWWWTPETARAYEGIVEVGGRVSTAMQAFRSFLGTSDTMAYLAMMAPRLVKLRRVLTPTGCLYLHCDPTASHYLKILLDSIFGPESFRSEIIWKRTSAHSSAKRPGPVHDVLFFYSRSDRYVWNPRGPEHQGAKPARRAPAAKGRAKNLTLPLRRSLEIPE